MIDLALGFLLGELNGFLGALYPSGEPRAVLSGIVGPDGNPSSGIDNRIVLSLVNLERETAAKSPPPAIRSDTGPALRTVPPLNLNLYLLLSASFARYEVSLGFLSASIGFLHSKPVFTPQNSAGFPGGLERLTIEMVCLGMQDLQNLWAAVGAKYLPSALYKLRMVTILDGWVTGRTPLISGAETKV